MGTDAPALNGPRWRRVRQLVIDRDTHCSICGDLVDKTLSGMHPMGPQAHHTLPRSKHPERTFDPAVVALAHRKCNERAGDRMPEHIPDAEPSRDWLA